MNPRPTVNPKPFPGQIGMHRPALLCNQVSRVMSALQIQLDIKRFEEAIKPGYAQRGTLNKASSPAWEAFARSVAAVIFTLQDSVFSDPAGPKWMQWRKSNASKLLLGMLRAAIESIASAPEWLPVAGGGVREVKESMLLASHSAMFLIGFLPIPAWPALREWLREQRGGRALWRALAWTLLEHDGGDGELDSTLHAFRTFGSVVSVLDVTSTLSPLERDRHAQPDPCISTCLGQFFTGLLPRLLASEETYAVSGTVHVEDLFSRMQTGVTKLCMASDGLMERIFPHALARGRPAGGCDSGVTDAEAVCW